MKIYEIDNSVNVKSFVEQNTKKDEYLKYVVEDNKIYNIRGGKKKDYRHIIDGNIIYDKDKQNAKCLFEDNKVYRLYKYLTEEEMGGMTEFRDPKTMKQLSFDDLRKQGFDPIEKLGKGHALHFGKYESVDTTNKFYKILCYTIKNNNEIYGIYKKHKQDKEYIESHFSTIRDNTLYVVKGLNKITGEEKTEATHYIEDVEDMSIEEIATILMITAGLGEKPKDDERDDIEMDDVTDAAKDIAKKGLNKLKGLFGKKKKK